MSNYFFNRNKAAEEIRAIEDENVFRAIENAIKEIDEKEKVKSNGCFCAKCKEFFPYAEPNMEDGTLICYSCRMDW